MNYDGHATPDGPSLVRELDGMTLRKAAVSDMNNNAYLLTCAETGAQLLIDAADDAPRLRALIDEGSGRLDGIATTHRHADHTRALAQLARETGAPTYAGTADADALPHPTIHPVTHGDRIRVGDLTIEVIEIRGHTPGGVALVWREPSGKVHLFTGDSLFPGGVGATNHYDYQSFAQLIDDVEARLFAEFDDATWFYPGHGDDSTLGAERPHLSQWRARGW